MGTIKCTSFTGIKQHLASQGPETIARFLQSLPPDMASLYKNIVPVQRLPIETTILLSEAIANFLYPNETKSRQLHQLGALMAQLDMKGLYKILLRITTVSYAIRQSAMFWNTFHDQGVTRVEEIGKNQLRYTISDYATMPMNYRIFLGGWIQGLLELCGTKNLSVVLVPDTAPHVVYDIRWS